ncbi:hypothetical protein D5086_009375 [Populus alba]|uniref:Uncharacterized protein n=1 Tax=Populus alba TaxID=43335 RepID=A0ACC4CKH2_POPAL
MCCCGAVLQSTPGAGLFAGRPCCINFNTRDWMVNNLIEKPDTICYAKYLSELMESPSPLQTLNKSNSCTGTSRRIVNYTMIPFHSSSPPPKL